MSNRTARRRLRDRGFSRRLCRKKVVIKFENRKKNYWHLGMVVGRKGGGQLSTNGVQLYSVTSHKFLLDRTSAYTYVWKKRGEGLRPDLVKGRTDRKFSVMVYLVWMYLLQQRRNT